MAHRIRILGTFPAGKKNIMLTGKGVNKIAVNGDLFLEVPYEDPHAITERLGVVKVFGGTVAAPAPELDLNGVWQASQALGLPEITQLTAVANTAHALDGKYLIVQDAAGSVAIWFDDTGSTVEPAHGADRSIKVTIANNDAATVVIAAVRTELNSDGAWGTIPAPVGAAIILTDAAVGERDEASAGTSGFTVTKIQDGDDADALIETTANNNELTYIEKVEWARNQYT